MISIICAGISVWASLPNSKIKNGLVETGASLSKMIDTNEKSSPLSRCQSESRGTRLFSNSCNQLVGLLKKKMNMMVIQSDLQMQAERLSKPNKLSTEKINWLAKINLLATQAEETIKAAQNNTALSDAKESLPDILNAVKKVETSYLAYSKIMK